MKKKINLFIHPGYGKTATTLLQEKIFLNENFENLGKPHNKLSIEKKKLISLQYKLFQPKYSFDRLYPLNLSSAVKEYTDELSNIVLNSTKESFILSDENILDRINYFGYFNIYLLKEVIDLLSLNFDINLKFLLTIRAQHEYLISSYAYDNFRAKKNFGSLDNFINQVLTNNAISEIFQFDLLVKKIKKIFNSEILILPMEELNAFSDRYISKINNFFKININTKVISQINVNSINIDNKKHYYIRTNDFRSVVENPVRILHKFLKKFLIYRNNFRKFEIVKNIISPKIIKKDLIKLNDNQIENIKHHFKQSNQNLEKENNINLKELNFY